MNEPAPPAVVVLIAEDETLVRMMLSEMLQENGYHVYEARDGQEALTILEVRAESVRALVTDISMPNLNGLDLAEIVSARWPHMGVVLASGHPPTDIRARMPGGAQFVAKPFREAELLKAVEAVIKTDMVPGPPVPLHNFPLLPAGQMHGAGGLAQPLPEPEE
ncbi:response regulator [Micromonospora sp. STR1s_5]|nr:response regulator [Micromonospora sp. STR1s_5]